MESYEKLPPQNIEAEQAVIGALLIDNNAITKVISILKPESFYKKSHQYIYKVILELFQADENIDVISVSNKLDVANNLEQIGGRAYINDLAFSIISSANIEYYAKIICENFKLRQIIQIGQDIAKNAYEKNESISILSTTEKKLSSVINSGITNDLEKADSILLDIYSNLEQKYNNKETVTGIPSGFYDLDDKTGGFQKPDLVIIAARPSMGKTALIGNITDNVAVRNNIPVAIFSLEMSKEQILQRMLFADAEINLNKCKSGKLEDTEWTKIAKSTGIISEAPIFIDDSAALSVSEIKAKAKKLQMENPKLGLIIIDYLQLMNSDKNKENRTQEISEISRGLKNLAKELNLPVIALSQLSRSLESRQNKRPLLSDLRESGSIEQDADIVLFIYRDEYYNPDDQKNKGKAELIIAKQRNGATGTVKLLFQAEYTKFKNTIRNRF